MKSLLLGIASAAILSSASASAATAIIGAPATPLAFNAAGAGQEFNIQYSGYIDSLLAPGLGASASFRFLGSADGVTWNFGITEIRNNSSAPITSSRISGYGFDVDPDAAVVTAAGLFNIIREDQNVPGLGTREVCIKAMEAKSCAGGGGAGLLIGEFTDYGGFSIQLAEQSSILTLSNFFVRFQSIEGGSGTSGIGVGSGIMSPVPEPSIWAMMIGGFGMVGGVLRSARRKQKRISIFA